MAPDLAMNAEKKENVESSSPNKAVESSGTAENGDGVKNLLDLSENGGLTTEQQSGAGSIAKHSENGTSPTHSDRVTTGTVVDIPPLPKNSFSNDSQERRREEKGEHRSKDPSTKKKKKKKADGDMESILVELQEKLQSEMAQKAEAEDRLRRAQRQLAEMQTHGLEQSAEFEKYSGLQTALQDALDSKEETESSLKSALQRIQSLEDENNMQEQQIEQLNENLSLSKTMLTDQEQELKKLRDQRDEQERKEMSLTNRLNAAKKKEAVKANEAEKYEEELKTANKELEQAKEELAELRKTKERLQTELEGTIVSSRQRQVQTEAALTEERKLNEERKQKMKVFIEKKSEELRQAKSDNEALQVELNQTSRSLSDLNVRWKQLHAQWVQSQTRNRELQREFHRIKKDSENLHKFGDTLEMKLSKSANETEEHKNKRLAAKNELMEVLRTLEAEREVSARLRDSIKFTFTPKALSQQQLLNESLSDFETQLIKLAMRLRRPIPPGNNEGEGSTSHDDPNDESWIESIDDEDGNGDSNEAFSRSDRETHRLIEKLNRETQQVSKCIMAIVGGIERLHLILESTGDRNCYSVLSDILASTGTIVGSEYSATGRHDETTAITGSRLNSISSREYHH